LLKEKNREVKEFMKDEYKHSSHYKRKVEDFKINKIMNRIRKKAKGPNPLAVKKKRLSFDGKEIVEESGEGIPDGDNNKKRKRRRKNKANKVIS
jgi:hypothetical protein